MHEERILWAVVALLYCYHAIALETCGNITAYSFQRSKVLDLEGTKAENATLSIIKVFTTNSPEYCANECCNNYSGICSVASFQSHVENGTCYLYKCFPVTLCSLTYHNGTDTFVALNYSETVNDSFSLDYAEQVLEPVHGDGTRSKARKGVLPEKLVDGPLKHDNTSVKPRKGVEKEHGESKARKGVEKETMVINTDLFTDDDTVTNDTLDPFVGTSPFFQLILSEPTNSSSNQTAALESNTFPSTTELNYQTVLPVNSSDIVDFTTPRSFSVSVTVKPVEHNFTTSTLSSRTELLLIENNTMLPELTSPVSSSVKTTSEEPLEPVVQDLKSPLIRYSVSEMSNWEFARTSSSFHLVIGLALGLIVLMTVMGVVAKRIHDSWQRRHYHRMDFLIDGMYHGDP